MPNLSQRRLLLPIRQSVSVPVSPPDSSYFHDTFTGANGTALASHTPDTGGAWSGGVGLVLSNGALVRVDPGGYDQIPAFNSVSASDYTLTVDYTPAGDESGLWIFFRLDSPTDYWAVVWSIDTWYLQDTTGGQDNLVVNQFSTSYFLFDHPGTTFTFKVVLNGPSIALYQNNIPVLSYSSAIRQAALGIGLDNITGSGQFDNLQVVA